MHKNFGEKLMKKWRPGVGRQVNQKRDAVLCSKKFSRLRSWECEVVNHKQQIKNPKTTKTQESWKDKGAKNQQLQRVRVN